MGHQRSLDRRVLFVLVCFAGLALWPLAASNFGIDLVTKIMIFAIFAMSLDLLVGYTGLVHLGIAAFFGIGAYLMAILTVPGLVAQEVANALVAVRKLWPADLAWRSERYEYRDDVPAIEWLRRELGAGYEEED